MTADPTTEPSVVPDPLVAEVLSAARARDDAQPSFDPDPTHHRRFGYPIGETRGALLYLLARSSGATRVVEFATSIGISTLYLAAAVRDNGGGTVVGAEIIPEKVATAQANLDAAGLAGHADIRLGDALDTLADLQGPIDLFLLDGWPSRQRPSLDRRVLELVAPKVRPGGLILDDNGEPDVRDYLRDPANGFRSLTLSDGHYPFELAIRA